MACMPVLLFAGAPSVANGAARLIFLFSFSCRDIFTAPIGDLRNNFIYSLRVYGLLLSRQSGAPSHFFILEKRTLKSCESVDALGFDIKNPGCGCPGGIKKPRSKEPG
jgi:hypothetical protein